MEGGGLGTKLIRSLRPAVAYTFPSPMSIPPQGRRFPPTPGETVAK